MAKGLCTFLSHQGPSVWSVGNLPGSGQIAVKKHEKMKFDFYFTYVNNNDIIIVSAALLISFLYPHCSSFTLQSP
jgi:hypothetical protein